MSVHPKHKLGEFFGMVLLASSALLLLSLISYNALDPSFNVSASGTDYSNYAGRVGAWLSDLLLQVFGLTAFLFPVPLIVVGCKRLRGRKIHSPSIKTAGFLLTVLALCSGLTLVSPLLSLSTEFEVGGALGSVLAGVLEGYFSTAGSAVLVVTILLLSLLLTTRFSVEATLDWTARRRGHFSSAIGQRIREWRESRRRRGELERIRRSKAVVAQPAPTRPAFDGSAGAGVPEADSSSRFPARDDPPPVVRKRVEDPVRDRGPDPQSSPAFEFNPLPETSRPHRPPPLDFLQQVAEDDRINEAELIERAQLVAAKCAEFDARGRVLQIHPGPVVTTFEFRPDPGVKYSRITNLEDDLCLALKAESIRIDRIPGKNTVGIEVPNLRRRTIYLRDILASAAFQQSSSKLTLGLGKLINGNTYITDLARMPHLLIAGATGAGKSVALNCLVCSILYKTAPTEVRFIMIDPKRLELGVYEDIPHLMTPIVTDPKQAANALSWAVREMEERYRLLARFGVRNIDQFNQLFLKRPERVVEEDLAPLPYIVVIVDELADLMMTTGKEVEAAVTRLAQMARAIGIHLILATQRPSVDVLTGLIKANFPCRISFRVSSKIDSRTILDANGAEQLLGQGDMLFLAPGTSRLLRLHGAYISEGEIAAVTGFLKDQASPEYREEILEAAEEDRESALLDPAEMHDELYADAARFVVETRKASTSLLQRRLRIGYGRAARLLDMMEHEGLISPPEGSRPREVLVAPDYFDEIGGGQE